MTAAHEQSGAATRLPLRGFEYKSKPELFKAVDVIGDNGIASILPVLELVVINHNAVKASGLTAFAI